jgi:hypothetical protein
MKINEILSEGKQTYMDAMREINAERPDIIWDKKTGKMGFHVLNTDPDRVLHKDGRYKPISEKGWEYIKNMQKFSDDVDESSSNSKYLTGKDKVAKISPVLGAKPKKQKALMTKFFGSD